MRLLFITFLTMLLPHLCHADTFHVVQKGETLSELAHQYFGSSVYGSGGGLEKILKMNDQIKNPNRIFVGMKIQVEDRVIASAKPISEKELSQFENKFEETPPSVDEGPTPDRESELPVERQGASNVIQLELIS